MLFRKKTEFEDEERGLSEIAKVIISLVFIIGCFIAANVLTDYFYEKEVARQYNDEYVLSKE